MSTLCAKQPVADEFSAQVSDLYRQHHRWLESWLRHKLDSVDSASDIAQDTFLRIIRLHDGNTLSQLDEPRAYLRTVAKRLLVNFYERQSLERAYAEALAMIPEAQMPSPEQRLLIFEALQEIDALLDALPAKTREAFLLSQLDGLSYAQIATALDVSERTVKRYMSAAFEQCLLTMQ
ncbi:sigma-70 family RNA polymerase sigma factor [Herbaspirillum lusitanum]|jgi:RNA polymerase sigma-70 factor (ECF subfamily)|uniref:Sigma-70 family RNA polymerase sigma factor n=1 Tax=Herbaspirillum lusitanum TaxID=213312 RepID=A0ABW9A710_9BURK